MSPLLTLAALSLGGLAGCRHDGKPPLVNLGSPDPSPPVHAAPCPGCIDLDAGGPPDWPDWAKDYDIPPLPDGVYVPPSVRIVGYPGSGLGTQAYVAPASGDLGLLFLQSGGAVHDGFEHPATFILDGSVPRGAHRLYDVWDGVSGYDGNVSDGIAATGDIDGDGHFDVWLSRSLYLGPMLGRRWPDYHHVTTAYAWVDEGYGVEAFTGQTPLAGAYDADGDGVLDVVMGFGEKAALYYGPIAGRLGAAGYVPTDPDTTVFGDHWCGGDADPRMLRNLLGPGRDAFSIGLCSGPTSRIWELAQPRGSVVRLGQAISVVDAWNGVTRVADAGDLDGDGFGDVWADYPIQNVWQGPPPEEFVDGVPLLTEVNGAVNGVLGDMNGDGVTELLGVTFDNDDEVVLFSPHAAPIDVATGLRVAYWRDFAVRVLGHEDIDGDGASDLVVREGLEDDLDEVRIWFGADLVAADATRRAGAAR